MAGYHVKKHLMYGVLFVFLLVFCGKHEKEDILAGEAALFSEFEPQVEQQVETGTVKNLNGEEVTVTITHPGVGVTRSQLDAMRDHVRAGDEPWASAFQKYQSNAKASRTPRIFYEEGNPDFVNVPNVWDGGNKKEYVTMRGNYDCGTAVAQAIMWYVTGEEVYRTNCMRIIRLWSKVQNITPEKEFRWGITGYSLCMAAEIMRYSKPNPDENPVTDDWTDEWTETDTQNFEHFLDECMKCNTYTTHFWMNQHDFATMGILSTGIFKNDFQVYATGVEQTMVNRNGAQGGNNGSIYWQCRLMTHNEETGESIAKESQTVQLIEAGRDQGHTYATISALSTLAQSIYLQGTLVDPQTGEISNKDDACNPFEFQNHRLLRGVRTAVRYNLGYEDPWITADSSRGYYREPSEASFRGRKGECLGILYNYYRFTENMMTDDLLLQDIAFVYERYMPEVISSNDYPLSATLLYTPENAKGVISTKQWGVDHDKKREMEYYSAVLEGKAEICEEGERSYVRMTDGTVIATSHFNGLDKKTMGICVKTNGEAVLKVRARHLNYSLKAQFELPDTKGGWQNFYVDIADTASVDSNMFYYEAEAEPGVNVDVDYLSFDTKEGTLLPWKHSNPAKSVFSEKTLIAAYDFEQAVGEKVMDTSGNGNDLTLHKKAEVAWDDKQQSKVLTLEGTDGSYAEMPVGILDGCEEYTLCMDVASEQSKSNFATFGIGRDPYYYQYFKIWENGISSKISRNAVSAEEGGEIEATVPKGEWQSYRIVCKKDMLRIYQNKQLVLAIAKQTNLTELGSELRLLLGKTFGVNDEAFCGKFDNISLYNYALDEKEMGVSSPKIQLTYDIGDGGMATGALQQEVLAGEFASPVCVTPKVGYHFVGWSDGVKEAKRQDVAVSSQVYYARFRKNIETSLFASYDMEEATANMVRDNSGNGNELMLHGAAKLTECEGASGKALYLDGSDGTYASLYQGLFDGRKEFTVSMDVKLESQTAEHYMTFAVGSDSNKYLFFRMRNDELYSAITTESWGKEQKLCVSYDALQNGLEGDWRNITIVYREASVELYLDGSLVGTQNITLSCKDLGENLSVYLGKSVYENDGYFKGYIDNVQIYNYAKSEAVISGSEAEEFCLNYRESTGGVVQGEVCQKVSFQKDAAKVIAVPQPGYVFAGWSDGVKTAERQDVRVTKDIDVYALFTQTQTSVSDGLVADYDISYAGEGTLKNRARSDSLCDAKLVGFSENDLTRDANGKKIVFTGNKEQYVELPSNLFPHMKEGELEEFSAELLYKTDVAANHWLFTVGNIVDQANYLFVNPNTPTGGILCAIKDAATEKRIYNQGAQRREGIQHLMLTYQYGKISLYLNGTMLATEQTDYNISQMIEAGCEGEVFGLIGKSLWAQDPGFCGEVYGIRIFDKALEKDRVIRRATGEETESLKNIKEEEPSVTPVCTITYHVNGGSKLKVSKKQVQKGKKIGTLPITTRKNYVFMGWYTKKTNGEKLNKNKIITKDLTCYARWRRVKAPARIRSCKYKKYRSGKAKITFSKIKDAAGYEVVYYQPHKAKKTVYTTKSEISLKNIKTSRVYYVKVRAYRLDSKRNKIFGAAKKIVMK